MSSPSTEHIAQYPKTALNGIYTIGPGQKLYFIPEDELARFEVPPGSEIPHDPVPEPETDEVGGRHAVPLRSGYVGWHSNWMYGPYIWHVDGNGYHGLHYHRGSAFAFDTDDL